MFLHTDGIIFKGATRSKRSTILDEVFPPDDGSQPYICRHANQQRCFRTGRAWPG